MKTYSKLLLAFFLLILVVPQVGADEPPENGPVAQYYENGQKKVEATLKDGKLVSASSWGPDGKPCPITKVVDGSGILVLWHVNGQKQSEEHFKNGKLDGLLTEWRENGQKLYEAHYKNGVKEGLATQWDKNGKKSYEIHYKDGEEVSRKEF